MANPAKTVAERDRGRHGGPFECEPWPDGVERRAPTVPAQSVRNVIAAAAPRVEPGRICQRVGLDSAHLHDPRGRVPMTTLVAAFEAAAALTGDRAFGLHVAARIPLRSFGLLGYIVMNCPTLGDTFDHLARYFPILSDGAVFRVVNDGSSVHLTWEYLDPSVGECRHDCEMTLLTVATIGTLLLGKGYRHREVHFQHAAPKDATEHRRLFRAPVHFSRPTNQLIFNKTVLSSPLTSADPALLDVLIQFGDSLLGRTLTHRTVVDSTRIALRHALLNGDARLTTVSRALAIGTRTLQRKLEARGATYSELLGSVRLTLAEHYLRDPQLPIGDIADRLAFAHPGEFHRAFRQWTGTTPRRFRRANST
jgi:AraC-like DNA-binding protein